MLTFLIIIVIALVLISASLLLVACMASARMTEIEPWEEMPLKAPETQAPLRSHGKLPSSS